MKITMSRITEYVEKGLITARPHNKFPLVIINYTPETAYEKLWDDLTLRARGLIFNTETEEILSAPFPKFFNYGETSETIDMGHDIAKQPHLYEVSEKLDGSLGISYIYEGQLYWATRGSFHSGQADKANQMWKEKYEEKMGSMFMDGRFTLLTEIIYPENKIVVDYREEEKMVLLAIRNIEQDEDISMTTLETIKESTNFIPFELAKTYKADLTQILEVQRTADKDFEGFVVRNKITDQRVKFKTEEYVVVHRAVYGMTDKKLAKLWAANDGSLELTLQNIPEEFVSEFESLVDKLDKDLEERLKAINENIKKFHQMERKDFALSPDLTQEEKSDVFAQVSGRINLRGLVVRKHFSKD